MKFKIANNNKPLMALLLSAVFSLLLMVIRIIITGNITYIFLAWNLILAFVPLLMAGLFKKLLPKAKKRLVKLTLLVVFAVWLLFFPNAPYIVTDLVHLNATYHHKFWYDLILIYLFAFSGISAGMFSLYWVHQGVQKLLGKAIGWILVIGTSFLAGYGVYLGRILRWNSWDLLMHPFYIIYESIHQLNDHTAQVITLSFALLMGCTYAMFISLLQYKQESYENI